MSRIFDIRFFTTILFTLSFLLLGACDQSEPEVITSEDVFDQAIRHETFVRRAHDYETMRLAHIPNDLALDKKPELALVLLDKLANHGIKDEAPFGYNEIISTIGQTRDYEQFLSFCRDVIDLSESGCNRVHLGTFMGGWALSDRMDGLPPNPYSVTKEPTDADIKQYLDQYLYEDEPYDFPDAIAAVRQAGIDPEVLWELEALIDGALYAGDKKLARDGLERLREKRPLSSLEEASFLVRFGKIEEGLAALRLVHAAIEAESWSDWTTESRADYVLMGNYGSHTLANIVPAPVAFSPENIAALALVQLRQFDEAIELVKSGRSLEAQQIGLWFIAEQVLWFEEVDLAQDLIDSLGSVDLQLMGYSLLMIGQWSKLSGKEQQTLVEKITALASSDELQNQDVRAFAQVHLAYIYSWQGEVGRAMGYYHKARAYWDQTFDDVRWEFDRFFRYGLINNLHHIIARRAAEHGEFDAMWYGIARSDATGVSLGEFLYYQAKVEPCNAIDRARKVRWWHRSYALAWVGIALYEREQKSNDPVVCH